MHTAAFLSDSALEGVAGPAQVPRVEDSATLLLHERRGVRVSVPGTVARANSRRPVSRRKVDAAGTTWSSRRHAYGNARCPVCGTSKQIGEGGSVWKVYRGVPAALARAGTHD